MPKASQKVPKESSFNHSLPSVKVSELFQQVMKARTRIYQLHPPTPMESYPMPGGWKMLLKREDLSEIHSYKWRGAFNFISARLSEAQKNGLVAASAGNHAQGVAKSASHLGVKAHLFMPKSATRLKVDSVLRLGGKMVEIHQEGDTFDDAAKSAEKFASSHGHLFVPPYDDLLVMAGQGVLGDEMMTSMERPQVVYIQIGGGGLAAGVAAVLKTYDKNIKVIGVEEEGQASMKKAFEAGKPVTLPHVDIFCDGTAVKKAGTLPYHVLSELLDDLVTVSTVEVSQAMEELWRVARVLSEPSGALGLAAARRDSNILSGRRAGIILSGANMDFRRLGSIARKAGDPTGRESFYQVEIPEQKGAMLSFVKTIVTPVGLNISHLMVGQYDSKLAYPVIGFTGPPESFTYLEELMNFAGYKFQNVASRPDLPFRVAPFQPRLFSLPYAAILHFPERPGALAEFLERIALLANISYFNYVHSGEEVGRALAVFSFENAQLKEKFLSELKLHGPHFTDLPRDTFHALGLVDTPAPPSFLTDDKTK
ncbi:MAG: pyridoxal-phosphate dependent enzyme [Deltaproteobacteria bacterium]|jgi:threonine dehydratase|nr:pyridoxal-phosphate dependent enzyme [Deltaproteobacteria bacterium]